MSLVSKPKSPFLWYDIKLPEDIVIQYGYSSNRFRGSTKTANRTEAAQVEANVRLKLLTGTYKAQQEDNKPSSGMTVQRCLDKALDELWRTHKSYKSFYTPAVDSFRKDAISSVPIDSLCTQIVNEWLAVKLSQGNARSTVNQKLGILRASLSRAAKVWGLSVPEIQWDDLKLKKAVVEHTVFFDDEQEARIHNYLIEHNRHDILDLVIVLADVGARFTSIVDIHRDQVDLQNRTIKLLDTKNGDDITLPLTERAYAVFARRVDTPRPFEDVTYDMTRAVWNRMRKKFGWPSGEGYKIHALRHTCGTKLAKAGVDIRVIQKWLGHRDIRQTARYTHVLDEQLANARDKLEKDK